MHFIGDEIFLSPILSFYNKTISSPINFFIPPPNCIRTIILSLIVRFLLSKTIYQQNNFYCSLFTFWDDIKFSSPNVFSTTKYFVVKIYDVVTNNLASFHIQLKF